MNKAVNTLRNTGVNSSSPHSGIRIYSSWWDQSSQNSLCRCFLFSLTLGSSYFLKALLFKNSYSLVNDVISREVKMFCIGFLCVLETKFELVSIHSFTQGLPCLANVHWKQETACIRSSQPLHSSLTPQFPAVHLGAGIHLLQVNTVLLKLSNTCHNNILYLVAYIFSILVWVEIWHIKVSFSGLLFLDGCFCEENKTPKQQHSPSPLFWPS